MKIKWWNKSVQYIKKDVLWNISGRKGQWPENTQLLLSGYIRPICMCAEKQDIHKSIIWEKMSHSLSFGSIIVFQTEKWDYPLKQNLWCPRLNNRCSQLLLKVSPLKYEGHTCEAISLPGTHWGFGILVLFSLVFPSPWMRANVSALFTGMHRNVM